MNNKTHLLLLIIIGLFLFACSPNAASFTCAGMPGEYEPYQDEAAGIAFCHPAGWLAEDGSGLGGGELLLSDNQEDPGVIILIYPHELVAEGILSDPEPPLNAEKALGQVAFLVMNSAAIDEADEELAEEAVNGQTNVSLNATGRVDWGDGEQPVTIIMAGYERDQATGAAVAYLFDPETHLETVQAILNSIEVSVPRLAEDEDAGHLPLNEFRDGAYQGKGQPGRHTFTATAGRPVLILLQNQTPLEPYTDLTIQVKVHAPRGLLGETLDFWFITWVEEGTATQANLFTPKRGGDYSLQVNKRDNYGSAGSYRIAVFDLDPEAATVLHHRQDRLAAGARDNVEIADTDGQPLMAYVRPVGPQPADYVQQCALLLELRDADRNKLAETETYTKSEPAFIYWSPHVAGPYTIRVQDQFDTPCNYELFVLVDSSTEVAEVDTPAGGPGAPTLFTYDLWDPDTDTYGLNAHNMALSADGRQVVIGAWLYDVGVAAPVAQGDETIDLLQGAAIAPAGDTFAVVGGGVYVWTGSGGETSTVLSAPDTHLGAMAFAADGQSLLGGDADGRIIQVDLASGEQRVINNDHTGAENDFDVLAFAVAPQGPLVACSRFDGALQLVDTTTGELTELAAYYTNADAVAFSPDSRYLAANIGREVNIFEISSGDIVATYQAEYVVGDLAYAPDGRFLVASTYQNGVYVWPLDGADGDALVLASPWPGIASAQAVAFNPAGDQIIAAYNNGTTATWTLPASFTSP